MFKPLLIAGVLLLLVGCRPEPEVPVPGATVVAQVGDEVITADELQLNIEFGFGHLRRGPDPKRTILDLMIREKTLALEAERQGLDTAAAVVRAMHTLEEELLIERVFEEHVLNQIEVTDEEIRAEIDRRAVQFRFRFLPALNEDDARTMREAVLERGWDTVLEERKRRFSEIATQAGELTSPYVAAEDLEPEMLELLVDLERGMPSQPVAYNDGWYLFEVMDIRQRRVGEAEYAEQAESARKVVYNRKAMQNGARFVADTMEPLNVSTKRAGFERLNTALWNWYRDQIPYADALEPHRDEWLVTFGDTRWSIGDFIDQFTPGRYVIRADEPRAFKARIADVVALVVRDHVFLEQARRERLDDDPAYRRNLALWRDKWLFQELRDRLPDTHLTRYADSVATVYTVEINETVLDTLQFSVSETNPYMTVHLLKNNSNKMPFPIVDPGWMAVR